MTPNPMIDPKPEEDPRNISEDQIPKTSLYPHDRYLTERYPHPTLKLEISRATTGLPSNTALLWYALNDQAQLEASI